MKLNVGCGNDYRKDYLNIDSSPTTKADKIVNLENPLPFKDNSVEEVFAQHILEHITNFEQLLKELYRICKSNALIKIKVPYFTHESAFSNYQHCRRFTWTTFDLFDVNHSEHFHIQLNFKTIYKHLNGRFSKRYHFANLFPRLYQEYLAWIFPVKELEVVLQVIK